MAGWRGDGNDRMEVAAFGMAGKGCCVRDGREGMLCSGWLDLGRVVSSEGRNVRSVNGGCAMILDSSLRCAAFRMTGGEGAVFGMAEWEGRWGWQGRDVALGMAEFGACRFE